MCTTINHNSWVKHIFGEIPGRFLLSYVFCATNIATAGEPSCSSLSSTPLLFQALVREWQWAVSEPVVITECQWEEISSEGHKTSTDPKALVSLQGNKNLYIPLPFGRTTKSFLCLLMYLKMPEGENMAIYSSDPEIHCLQRGVASSPVFCH